jgi:4-hydroxy-2-oxoheptanedioate aldolase
MLFVGPGDLSDAIGKPGQMQDPEVLALAEKIIKTAIHHEKIGGMFCATYEDVERAIGWGAKFIAFSSELNILQAHFRSVVSNLHNISQKS